MAEPIVEPARPIAVVPAIRTQWESAPGDPAWPDNDRRINDRREVEVQEPLASPAASTARVTAPTVAAQEAATGPSVVAPSAGQIAPPAGSSVPTPGGMSLSPSLVGDLLLSTSSAHSTEVVASLQRVVLASAPQVVLNLEIHAGEFVVLSGPSSSGKTSLLRVLAGMDGPLAGRVVVNGEEFQLLEDEDRRTVEGASMAFVATWSTFVPDLTVLQNVEIPLLLAGSSPSMARGATTEMLVHLGLGAVMDRMADRLSTSELRLACVARALITQPPIVIADDPTSGLDRAAARFVLAALQEAQGRGATIVMSSSDARLRLDGPRHLRIDAGVVSDDSRPA